MCGAGVHIENNIFEENMGLKRHNGGAAVHRCLVYDNFFKGARLNTTSSLELAERNKTDADVGNFTYWYDDPMTTVDNFTDIYNNNTIYEVLKYVTHIKNNKYKDNTTGMKGSALLISFINAVLLEDNEFLNNRP